MKLETMTPEYWATFWKGFQFAEQVLQAMGCKYTSLELNEFMKGIADGSIRLLPTPQEFIAERKAKGIELTEEEQQTIHKAFAEQTKGMTWHDKICAEEYVKQFVRDVKE